jgi:thiamine pyrophosphate-dependent acetolactate synthase large subunit-like protein
MSKELKYPYTLSSVLLESLTSMGIEYLFGVAGSAERDFFDTLARDEYKGKITFIQGNSEYPAARMSLGYARASERVSPLILHVQYGPANAALAVLDAYVSKIPLLIFTVGHISTANDYREALYGYSRTPELLQEYSKHVYRIVDASNVDKIIKRALRLSETLPSGPVFLTVSQDIIEAPVSKKRLKKTNNYSPSASEDIIHHSVEVLKKANKPAIITHITRNKASVYALVELAEKIGAAVFETWPRGMNFPTSHPLHQGYLTDKASMMRQYLSSCDVILTLDCARAPWMDPPIIDSAFYIQVSDNPLAFNEDADIKIFSSTESFLKSILRNLKETDLSSERIDILRSRHEAIRKKWMSMLKVKFDDDPPYSQRVWFEINRLFNGGREYIVFFAPGFTQRLPLLRYLERDVPGCYYRALTSAMGSAGEAIGVQLADKRRVICVLGDFEAHVAQLPTLLWTCAHHNIPVVWIVMDNATGATVKREFWAYGKYMRDEGTFIGIDLDEPRTDWIKIAEANSVKAIRCEHTEELKKSIEKTLTITGPVLLSIATQTSFKSA